MHIVYFYIRLYSFYGPCGPEIKLYYYYYYYYIYIIYYYIIWCGVHTLGDSGVHTLGDTSASVNLAGQLLLTPSSSPPSSYSHFYVGSMYGDIRLDVARAYTSSADSPFSLISSFTLSNHLLLDRPLFILPCTYIAIALLPT